MHDPEANMHAFTRRLFMYLPEHGECTAIRMQFIDQGKCGTV